MLYCHLYLASHHTLSFLLPCIPSFFVSLPPLPLLLPCLSSRISPPLLPCLSFPCIFSSLISPLPLYLGSHHTLSFLLPCIPSFFVSPPPLPLLLPCLSSPCLFSSLISPPPLYLVSHHSLSIVPCLLSFLVSLPRLSLLSCLSFSLLSRFLLTPPSMYFFNFLNFNFLLNKSTTLFLQIFHVNWFRKQGGKFIWPGFGDNSRVLEWIFDRTEGSENGQMCPIGVLPKPGKI